MDEDETQETETELEKSEYNYFRSVFKQLQLEFNDDKDRAVYVRNVFKAMAGHELQIACHTILSRSLEQLLLHGNAKQTAVFFQSLSDHFSHLSTHSAGSYILQSLLEISLKHITNAANAEKYKKSLNLLNKLIVRYGQFVCNNAELLLKDVHACPVISTLLETLSGCKVSQHIMESKKVKTFDRKAMKELRCIETVEVPKKFTGLFKKLIERCFLKADDLHLNEIMKKSHSSKLVQTALLVSSKCDPSACQQLLDIAIKMLFNDEMDTISDCSFAPLIDKVLDVCSPEQYSSIWTSHFKGHLGNYLLHPIANFVGQHLIKSCPTKTEFEEIFEETSSLWDDIFQVRHLGVLVALSEACVKLNCCQAKFVDRLAQLLHCSDPKDRKLALVPLTAKCVFYEASQVDHSDLKGQVNYHGSLLIQHMLHFQKPLAVIESLLNMDFAGMTSLFCDRIGSHIMDAFVSSKTVGQKSKQRLINKIKGNFSILAMDKYASFCLEKLWRSIDVKAKLIIMDDLANHDKKLKSNKFGNIVYLSFAVSLFKSRPSEWEQWQVKGVNKRKMFNDILPSKKQKSL